VDDTANWEFAAAAAAVIIGLGGLVLLTVLGAIGWWRLLDQARRSAAEASSASLAVQELARQLAEQAASEPEATARLYEIAAQVAELRRQSDVLLDQQGRLRTAIHGLAAVEGTPAGRVVELEDVMRRLEDNLRRVSTAAPRRAHD
jgi:hypothetical protein